MIGLKPGRVAMAILLASVPGRAATVIASTYWPGDGVVPRDDYQTSSGERYDKTKMRCASLDFPLGTKLYLRHGQNAAEVIINDRGPFVRGRKVDCTPAVDKALHLDGLGKVSVEYWPPLPKEKQ